VANPMTSIDLQGHWPIGSHFKWDFSYSCASVDQISADMEHHVVPLRSQSFSFLKQTWTWLSFVIMMIMVINLSK